MADVSNIGISFISVEKDFICASLSHNSQRFCIQNQNNNAVRIQTGLHGTSPLTALIGSFGPTSLFVLWINHVCFLLLWLSVSVFCGSEPHVDTHLYFLLHLWFLFLISPTQGWVCPEDGGERWPLTLLLAVLHLRLHKMPETHCFCFLSADTAVDEVC